MSKWEDFELACTTFLNQEYGGNFIHYGSNDSTLSDIQYSKDGIDIWIEAKMPEAQSGQFVLIQNYKKKIFTYSSRNKTLRTKNINRIIEFMNKDFEFYSNPGTSGIMMNLPSDLMYNTIKDMYQQKNVNFFITGTIDNFIIFPLKKLNDYFEIFAKYRVKKSGSSQISKNNLQDIKKTLNSQNIIFEFNLSQTPPTIITKSNLANKKIHGESYCYLFKTIDAGSNEYFIRRLSNTANANIIFSLKLKSNQNITDLKEFESAINFNSNI